LIGDKKKNLVANEYDETVNAHIYVLSTTVTVTSPQNNKIKNSLCLYLFTSDSINTYRKLNTSAGLTFQKDKHLVPDLEFRIRG
jgi:hypothetical protein